ncbi:MAG: hypothetical protein AAFV36_08060 [Myxococcota bacterium]
MRSTVNIDEDLMKELRARAHRENVSLTRMLNRLLRAGMYPERARSTAEDYVEETYAMGEPSVPLEKALSVAAALEEDETVRKLAMRK